MEITFIIEENQWSVLVNYFSEITLNNNETTTINFIIIKKLIIF